MKKILPAIVMIASIAISCGKSTLFQSYNGFTQGTTFNIVYQELPFRRPEKINRAIDNRLTEIDNSLSVYNKQSLISAINSNETVVADTMFAQVFRLSERISALTDGLFDITVGPLVKTWGFGPDALKSFDPSIADSLMQFVGYKKVRLLNGTIVKDDPRIWIDVNAIAQGYTVDVICNLLDDYGIENYLVEIGGEVRARGVKVDRLWRVGVDRPEDNNNSPGDKLVAVVELDNEALATSGNYRKFHVEGGIKYSHTIDPRSGAPARNRLLSATIISTDAATADAFATACMVAGPEGAIEMIGKYDFLEGYLIYSGDNGEYLTWTSEGLKARLKEE